MVEEETRSFVTAKLSHNLTLSITSGPSIGRPKRNKAHHLTMVHDNDELETDYDPDSDDSSFGAGWPKRSNPYAETSLLF